MPFEVRGRCSYFGGPDDMGVAPDEGLAFIYTVEDKSDLFLSYQPEDTTGLARRLNPAVPYVACRWPYTSENKDQWRDVLLREMALVTNKRTGAFVKAYPADWGPHEDTDRVADLSQKVMEKLDLATDDEVEIVFPYTSRGEVELPRYKSICISSGHSTKCQGANGHINEVEEATRVTDLLAEKLRERAVEVMTFHDTVSTEKNECLDRICDWHNDQDRELDLSVHFNASQETNAPVGTEMWYITQDVLARELSAAVASVGFKDRGAKWSDSLWFLNQTLMPSVLLEICFVDSTADCDLYKNNIDQICEALATVLGGERKEDKPPPELVPENKQRRRIFFRRRRS
jgi:N-acetylmuramoyl-L-alanine amidase